MTDAFPALHRLIASGTLTDDQLDELVELASAASDAFATLVDSARADRIDRATRGDDTYAAAIDRNSARERGAESLASAANRF